MFDRFRQDTAYAMRSLRRSPGFFAIAVGVLGLGIGMSTAIASVLHTVALRDLPTPSPDELVLLHAEDLSRGFDHLPIRHAMFEEFVRSSRVLESATALQYAGSWPRDFADGDRVFRAAGVTVARGFFETLGRPVAHGRALRDEDYQTGSETVMVISDALWEREFARQPDAIGRGLRLVAGSRTPIRIVGIMPEEFRLPGGADYWIPLASLYSTAPVALDRVGVDVIGRLSPGASIEAASAEFQAFLGTQDAESGYREVAAVARSLTEAEVGEIRPALLIVTSAAALLLLIACFNVATLVLMRGSRRVPELRVRSALGASAARLTGQLTTESALLAGCGGLAGLALVGPILDVFIRLAPPGLPRVADIGFTATTFAIGVGGTVLVALLAGVLPVFGLVAASRGSLVRGGRQIGNRRASVARRLLVSTQFGLALVVLAASGLVLKSLARLQALDPGFDTENVVLIELAGPADVIGEAGAAKQFFDRLLPDLEARAGVLRAAAVLSGPFSGSGGFDGRFAAEGQSPEQAESNPWLNLESVTPGYFETLGIQATGGRLLGREDGEGSPGVVLLSEDAARQIWPGEDPIGRRIQPLGDGESFTVVGIVPDTRYRAYRETRPSVYFSAGQAPFPFYPSRLVIRTSGSLATAIASVRQSVAAVDADVVAVVVSPMPELIAAPLAQPRLNVVLLSVFAGAALILAAVGLYAVLSFGVRQRRRELGIRQALGASAGDVAKVILTEGLTLAVGGAVVGLGLALAMGSTLRAILFEVDPADPVTLGGIVVLLGAVSLLACWLPARQAAQTDPNDLLRAE